MARFLIKPFGPEAVVFDNASGDTHYLSPLAQAIYSICLEQPGLACGEIVPLVAARLAIRPEPALCTQTQDILSHLHRIGLIDMR
ncbi:MAG: HPr-rel-A system PqqD family peptide chaperone [Hyphomicrobiaceae bacterium]